MRAFVTSRGGARPPSGLAPSRAALRRLACGVAVALALAPPASAQSLIRDAEIERTLARMSAPILQAAGLSPSTVDIYMIQDRALNAFVAGGRNMFLYTGLLVTLETPEELLAVIAHEAGHIAGGHLTRRQINIRNVTGPALIGTLVGLLAGVAGGGGSGVALAGASQGVVQRALLAYNRGEEAAADQAGLDYLARTGVSPVGMLKVMNRFRGQEVFAAGNVNPYVLSHPLSTERLQLIDAKVAAAQGTTKPYDADLTYWHARARAKLRGFLDDPQRVLDDLDGVAETEITLIARAVALHRLPDRVGAMAAVDRLIALRPADPYYIELKGQLLYETGDPAAAAEHYARASALAPGEALLKTGLGRALLALETPEADARALAVLEAARSGDVTDPLGLRDLATAYDRAGNRGMATLATAERFAIAGDLEDAALHAGRAAVLLPVGSPGWVRAQDILAQAPDEDD